MTDAVIADAKERMQKTVEAVQRELDAVRTGRASPRLIENLKVDYYGTPTPLNQIAGIAAPEPHLLTIQPWDRNAMGPIEKALQTSDLGLNPSNDGTIIRLAIPPLNEDRRKELVKLVHKKTEDGRVAIRNVRRDVQETVRKQERAHEISEDESRRLQDALQKVTDEFVAAIDEASKAKESEVLEV